MTFLTMLNICKNYIDETDQDDQIDIILKSALNEAYTKLQQFDKRITTAYIPIVNGIASLPDNFLSLVKSTPELKSGDKIIGRGQIMTSNTGVLTLVYTYTRDELVSDTDEPVLNNMLQNAMIPYACYKYFLYKKKVDVASLFLNNYSSNVSDYGALNDTLEETTQDVDYFSSSGDTASYDW